MDIFVAEIVRGTHISFILLSHQISYRKYTHNNVDRLVFFVYLQLISQIKILKQQRQMFKVNDEVKDVSFPLSNCLNELLERS